MKDNNLAVADAEVNFDEGFIPKLFGKDCRLIDKRSYFTIADDLRLSVRLIEELDSIEMQEGFIY